MKYLLLFLIAPGSASFIVQCILCCKIKNRILRHGTLVLSIVFIILGIITLLTPYGDIFSALGVITSVLWFAGACCAALGYGAAWTVTLTIKNRRTKKWKRKQSFAINLLNKDTERRDMK